jgi:ABC-2 type transport system permease protein
MAMTAPLPERSTPARPRRVSVRHFARLKLRVIRNGLRGQGWRIALFIGGSLFGLWVSASGFFLLAAAGLADNADLSVVLSAFAGAALVLGWLLLPLVFFGVDETLDPARFALLPLSRRTLVAGLLTAALLGVPAAATLLATCGLVLGAAVQGGWAPALAQAAGVVAGLVLCVAASRAITSAFATMLRSRRVRDLAAIMLALLAALLGPLQIAVLNAGKSADYHQFVGPARVLGWTPLAAPYTLGADVISGRGWAVPIKLAITLVTIGALLWWWSASLEAAMVGGEASGGPARRSRGIQGGPVTQLYPRPLRWLSRQQAGALVAREVRYWWRDARRRANLITFAVIGTFIPIMINVSSGGSLRSHQQTPAAVTISVVLVGVLAAVTLANQFGFDGSAYAANVIAAVPGTVELRSRIVAFSIYIVPLLTCIGVVVPAILGQPGWLAPMLGGLYAAYGVGLAVNLFVSIFAAFALPETANPFAMNSGRGVAKSLLSLVGLIASMAGAAPFVVAAVLFGDAWTWLAIPVGVGYGLAAAALGCYIAGDVLDRRMPELLAAVTPRR